MSTTLFPGIEVVALAPTDAVPGFDIPTLLAIADPTFLVRDDPGVDF
jgi:hypothetical protein